MDSREEDKGEGRTWGGIFCFWDILVYGKVRKFGGKKEEGRKQQFCWNNFA
jgi:hypothetical protein